MPHETYPCIFTLGPPGTFSDEATQRVCSESSEVVYTHTFAETLFRVTQTPEAVAVVPIENSVAGIVAPIQDMLVTHELIILEEVNVLVRYALLSDVTALDQVRRLYAHPQAFEQTSQFTALHFPAAEVSFTNSNVDSEVQFHKAITASKGMAAIVPMKLSTKNSQFLQARDIQDYENNTTRFVVVRHRSREEQFDFSRQKTSILVELAEDRSGMLYELLSVFKQFEINLCRLESRPSKHIPWVYVFYVDFHNTPQSQQCLKALNQAPFHYTILGSYDLRQES